MSQLGTHLPVGCPAEHVAPLLEQRRDAHGITALDGTGGYLELDYDGTDQDRELARTEIQAALADLGCPDLAVSFSDEQHDSA